MHKMRGLGPVFHMLLAKSKCDQKSRSPANVPSTRRKSGVASLCLLGLPSSFKQNSHTWAPPSKNVPLQNTQFQIILHMRKVYPSFCSSFKHSVKALTRLPIRMRRHSLSAYAGGHLFALRAQPALYSNIFNNSDTDRSFTVPDSNSSF